VFEATTLPALPAPSECGLRLPQNIKNPIAAASTAPPATPPIATPINDLLLEFSEFVVDTTGTATGATVFTAAAVIGATVVATGTFIGATDTVTGSDIGAAVVRTGTVVALISDGVIDGESVGDAVRIVVGDGVGGDSVGATGEVGYGNKFTHPVGSESHLSSVKTVTFRIVCWDVDPIPNTAYSLHKYRVRLKPYLVPSTANKFSDEAHSKKKSPKK
jgi:hypothetical protein